MNLFEKINFLKSKFAIKINFLIINPIISTFRFFQDKNLSKINKFIIIFVFFFMEKNFISNEELINHFKYFHYDVACYNLKFSLCLQQKEKEKIKIRKFLSEFSLGLQEFPNHNEIFAIFFNMIKA